MYESLLIILLPMLLGYLLKLRDKRILQYFSQITMILLYAILFVIGLSLGQLENLAAQLPKIGLTGMTFALLIQGLNLLGLVAYDKIKPQPLKNLSQEMPSRLGALLEALKLCFAVCLGFALGFGLKNAVQLPLGLSTYFLVILIFCVGVQLRNNGIHVRTVLFNRRAMMTGLIFILTSFAGGIIGAYILDLPLTQGLAVASGFGWYSLSSVTLNNAWGAAWGSIAFFNDLSRELLSLFIIPFFMPTCRSTAVGFTGATSLDCTLPIIQKAGGIEVVPLAISFGFITNVLPPILLMVFTSIPI